MEKLSIVIPAYARHPMTVRHVEECMRASRLPDEIIVVNDGGDPCLREMLFQLKRNVPIVYARVEEDILWNYNGAVNLGFWIATGDYVAIEDTDHIPNRHIYANAIKILNERPEIGRVAVKRKVTPITEMNKPLEKWQSTKVWGSNQMVTILRRDVYIQLKGQDERFARNYGYMAMDWHCRYNNILKVQSAMSEFYYALVGDEGEPGLRRGMSIINRGFYKENSMRKDPQHPDGILNFIYTFERWNTSQ